MLKRLKLKVQKNWDENNITIKLMISLFICGIIFSILGIPRSSEKDELYYFYLISSNICFSIWFIFLPIKFIKLLCGT